MTEYGDSIRASVGVNFKIQVRPFEPLEISVNLSQVHMACDEEDINNAVSRVHELLAHSMTAVFQKAQIAREDLTKADEGVFS